MKELSLKKAEKIVKKEKKQNKRYFKKYVEDSRVKKFKQYKKEHGFNPTDIWSLDVSISLYILPRLCYFRDNLSGYPADFINDENNDKKSTKEWRKVLNKMINSFYLSIEKPTDRDLTELNKEIKEGLELFSQYFGSLWD